MNDHFYVNTCLIILSLTYYKYITTSQGIIGAVSSMGFSKLYLYVLLICTNITLHFVSAANETNRALDAKNLVVVNVGLILDFNSSVGFVANSCISMAISDFYSKNPHYTTRLALHTKNSNDVLTAASAGEINIYVSLIYELNTW